MYKVMKQQIRSIYDDLPLGITIMEPDQTPKGIIQIAHGMCEYRERYEDFMNYICDQGFICAIHDHRGHGESIKNKEDLGYFYDDSGEFIVEDLHQIMNYMKEQYCQLPLYLMGHSMGSLVVRNFIKKYDYEIDGLIVCGSPSKNVFAPIGKILTKLFISIKGDRYRSNFIHNMAFSAFGKKFNEDSKHAWICTKKDVVKDYDNDEYCNYQFTLNGFLNLFTLMIKTYQDDHWILRNPNLPIFFIAGSEDPCIVSEKQFYKAVDFMRIVGYHNVSCKLYAGKRHEILNEDIKETVYEDIVEYINDVISKT